MKKKIEPEPIGKIAAKIIKSKSFLITAHVNLEGDALGSELAMLLLLKRLKKRAVIYNNDLTPAIYRFLPYNKIIKNHLPEKKVDTAFILDCSDISRTGKVKDSLSKTGSIINIDHHISNTYFGDINWVDPTAGSTAQMVYRLCKKFKIIDKDIALCLYTGIMTDTGSFTYANTDQRTHRITSDLMAYGISAPAIYERIHSLCSPLDLGFIGKIISSLKFDSANKVCWATITEWEDKNYDLTEVIFSIMRLLKEPEVFILFKKMGKNRTRVNFRSRLRVDVDEIAKSFGGGGHKRASGTTLEDPLEASEKKVISFVNRSLKAIQ